MQLGNSEFIFGSEILVKPQNLDVIFYSFYQSAVLILGFKMQNFS